MGLASNMVELSSYSKQWDKLFQEEKKFLKKILGDNIRDVVHVGSTSIPQMKCAKPVIDIAVGVDGLKQIDCIKDILISEGYYHNPNAGAEDRLYFAKGSRENRIYNIHVEIIEGVSWKNHMEFRDKLMAYPEYIEQYCDLKKELAFKYPNDRLKYTEGKAEFIRRILDMKE